MDQGNVLIRLHPPRFAQTVLLQAFSTVDESVIRDMTTVGSSHSDGRASSAALRKPWLSSAKSRRLGCLPSNPLTDETQGDASVYSLTRFLTTHPRLQFDC